MKTSKKVIHILIALIVLVFFSTVVGHASSFSDISLGEEISLPDDLALSIESTCSTHPYFMQVSARADGVFVVYSRCTTTKKEPGNIFKRVYLDLYDNDGDFLKEISFDSPFEFDIELSDQSINMYFRTYVLVFDLKSETMKCYSVHGDIDQLTTPFNQFGDVKFSSGNWDYHCVKSVDGFTKLTRSNNDTTQLLVEMPGTGMKLWKLIILPIILALVLGYIPVALRKVKDRSKGRTF